MQDILIYWLAALNLVWPAAFLAVYLRRYAREATTPPPGPPPGTPQESSEKFHRLVDDYQEVLDLVSHQVGQQGKSLTDAGRLVASQEPSEAPRLKVELTRRLSEIIAANDQLRQDLLVAQIKLSAQHVELDRARIESRIDHLTGLANRRAFDEKIHELHLCQERQAGEYVLAIFDLDQFKAFNDSHGHAAGDAILKTIGKVVSGIRRPTDFLARIGGEEFAILISGIGLPQGQQILEHYRKAIETTKFRTGGDALSVTATFGVAISQPNEPFAELMTRADQALYAAKGSGRNRIGVHNGSGIVYAGTPCSSSISDDDSESVCATPELTASI